MEKYAHMQLSCIVQGKNKAPEGSLSVSRACQISPRGAPQLASVLKEGLVIYV